MSTSSARAPSPRPTFGRGRCSSASPQAEFLDATEEMLLPRVYEGIGDPDVASEDQEDWQVGAQPALRTQIPSRPALSCGRRRTHRHPPANGLRINTSIADSFNLAWKLAAVLNGVAGKASLTVTTPSDSQWVTRSSSVRWPRSAWWPRWRQSGEHQVKTASTRVGQGRDIVRCNTRK